MWGVMLSECWDWIELKKDIKKNGLCNSLLVVLMLIVFIFQILGNNECFELYISNIYSCCMFFGEFVIVNKYLLCDLNCLGLWNDDMKYCLMVVNGLIQSFDDIF